MTNDTIQAKQAFAQKVYDLIEAYLEENDCTIYASDGVYVDAQHERSKCKDSCNFVSSVGEHKVNGRNRCDGCFSRLAINNIFPSAWLPPLGQRPKRLRSHLWIFMLKRKNKLHSRRSQQGRSDL